MTMTPLLIDEIVSDPDVRAGRPVLRGTGIRVSDIVCWHRYGDHLTAEQIAADHQLPLGQVYAALTYYYLHQPEIDTEIRQNEAEAQHWIEKARAQGQLVEINDSEPDQA
jgi:uncharacterized protein (DUF433 family)